MDLDPDDATLLSNRSLCWLYLGEGGKALVDAHECRKMRPDWPKACYRQGAALMLLKVRQKIITLFVFVLQMVFNVSLIFFWQDYVSACEALFDGFKLDPEDVEIENALR